MPEVHGGKGTALAAALAAVGTVVATIANLAGIAQLHEAPLLLIVGTLALAALILGLYAMSAKRQRQQGWSWLAGGAIFCASIALIVTAVSTTKGDARGIGRKDTTTQPSTTSPVPPSTTKSTPSSPSTTILPSTTSPNKAEEEAAPLYKGDVELAWGSGSDFDKTAFAVNRVGAAAGAIDLAMMYYGNLQGAGKGFFQVFGPVQVEKTCRETISRELSPQKEVIAVPGYEYCLRTSEGNIAWIQVVDTALDRRTASITVKVWRK